MSDKPMTADEALEILKDEARHNELNHDFERDARKCEICAALAFFENKHVYVSRFQPGDEVWLIVQEWSGQWLWEQTRITHTSQCFNPLIFPTRAEAEAEAARRNQEGEK